MTVQEFNESVYPLRDGMYRFALAILSDREAAEDAVQGVLERLWLRLRSESYVRNIEAFAMSSVRNACYDVLRRRRLFSGAVVQVTEQVPEDGADWDVRKMVKAAMETLPRRQRMVVELKDIEGFEVRDIAEILRMTEGHVRAELSRARRKLKERIVKIMEYGDKGIDRSLGVR